MQLLPKRRDYVLVTFNDALLLLSHAQRVKGFYSFEDVAAIRHYEPRAAHAGLQAQQPPLRPDAHEPHEERAEPGDDNDDDADDGAFSTSVELELSKPKDSAGQAAAASSGTGGGGGGGASAAAEGRAALKLKRFSLAFTAAIASLTDQRTLVLRFPSEADKAAWVHDVHRAVGSGGNAATASALFAPSLLAAAQRLGPALASASVSTSSGSPSRSAASGPSPASVAPPSFGTAAASAHGRAPPVGSVPVLPARPRAPTASEPPLTPQRPSPTATEPPATAAAALPFSYTRPALGASSPSALRALLAAPPTAAAASARAEQPNCVPRPPLLSEWKRLQAQHSASASALSPSPGDSDNEAEREKENAAHTAARTPTPLSTLPTLPHLRLTPSKSAPQFPQAVAAMSARS